MDAQRQVVPLVELQSNADPAPIVDASVANTIYYGYAELGTATTEPKWKIVKSVVAGNITTTTYADGNMKYDNVWDDRTSLNYSR